MKMRMTTVSVDDVLSTKLCQNCQRTKRRTIGEGKKTDKDCGSAEERCCVSGGDRRVVKVGRRMLPIVLITLSLCAILSPLVSGQSDLATAAGGAAVPAPLELKYRLEEEQPVGTFVADVVRDAHLAKLYDSSALRRLQFRFLSQLQRLSSSFSVDNTTGVIRTVGRVDREAVCAGVETCELRLDVAVQPLPHFRIVRITVTILDINDNWPTYSDREQTVEVLESAQLGTVLFVPDAVDPDSPEFGVQGYRLLSDSDRFELVGSERRADGTFDTKLVIAKALDRESVDSYSVQIVALDGGFPPKTGSVDLTIYVLDVNDNSPVFEREGYEVSISENLPLHTTILQVRASDNDIGLNGAVTYSFSVQTAAGSSGHLFGIDNSTGDVYIRAAIDYEESPTTHRLVVVARDRGLDSVPVSAVVVVQVLDANDNAPEVTVETLSTVPGAADIAEDSDVGTFVGHVTVSDKDSGNNGRFTCALNDAHFQLTHFSAYDTEFQIVTAARLDRETRSFYNLTLTCRDGGIEPQSSTARIDVRVIDVNDNSPVFTQSTYKGELIENNYMGAVITQVTATDRDAGDNAAITYSLDGAAAQQFSIDATTGTVTAAVSFDRELDEIVHVTVVARDAGSPTPRSSSALVLLNIFDVNDEWPVFSPQPAYTFAVLENQPEGTAVGAVAAHDADSTIYGEVTYSLLSSTLGAEFFHINHKTGELVTTRPLDREVTPSYNLVVMATDRGVPPLSATASVSVLVSDLNDNAPIFDYPPPTSAAAIGSSHTFNETIVYVSNMATIGYIVARLRAHDLDIGSNAMITYLAVLPSEEVESGERDSLHASAAAPQDVFDLDSSRGLVMVGRDLSGMDGRHFRLAFIARDQGSEPQTSVAPVFLNIYVNKSAPIVLVGYGGRGGDDRGGLDTTGGPNGAMQNLIIVIALAVGSGIVTVILIVAIVLIRRQDRNRGMGGGGVGGVESRKYNCRAEELKMLKKDPTVQRSDSEAGSDCSGTPGRGCDDADYCKEKSVSLHVNSSASPNGRTLLLAGGGGGGGGHHVGSPLSTPQGSADGSSACGRGGCGSDLQSPTALPQLNNKELEVQRLLKALQRDNDDESLHSGDGSNTDSGRGISDEGGGGDSHQRSAHHDDSTTNNSHVESGSSPTVYKPSRLISAGPVISDDSNCSGSSSTQLIPSHSVSGQSGRAFISPSSGENKPSISTAATGQRRNNCGTQPARAQPPTKPLNSFGSTGCLHRSNLDDDSPPGVYSPEVVLQNVLNQGFVQPPAATMTMLPPSRSQPPSFVAAHSATLPPRANPSTAMPYRGDVRSRNGMPGSISGASRVGTTPPVCDARTNGNYGTAGGGYAGAGPCFSGRFPPENVCPTAMTPPGPSRFRSVPPQAMGTPYCSSGVDRTPEAYERTVCSFVNGSARGIRGVPQPDEYSLAESDATSGCGQYSCADMSDILGALSPGATPHKGVLTLQHPAGYDSYQISQRATPMGAKNDRSGFTNDATNGRRAGGGSFGTPASQCSSAIDASELCHEIDALFFNNMRASNC